MKREIQDKIKDCKALQGMTVEGVIRSGRFLQNFTRYWMAQKEDRAAIRASYAAMQKAGGAKGYKLPAHPIDRFLTCCDAELIEEFIRIIGKRSDRSAAERKYLRQLGLQAYNLTVAQYVVDEFPELAGELIPSKKNAA